MRSCTPASRRFRKSQEIEAKTSEHAPRGRERLPGSLGCWSLEGAPRNPRTRDPQEALEDPKTLLHKASKKVEGFPGRLGSRSVKKLQEAARGTRMPQNCQRGVIPAPTYPSKFSRGCSEWIPSRFREVSERGPSELGMGSERKFEWSKWVLK